ncbi:MAG: hypothetical protein ACLP53_20240 [Isosphaeraceae bacterium]
MGVDKNYRGQLHEACPIACLANSVVSGAILILGRRRWSCLSELRGLSAGGFGQAILAGIRRDDYAMILFEGAIPDGRLALFVQGAFDIAERFLVPKGLRL